MRLCEAMFLARCVGGEPQRIAREIAQARRNGDGNLGARFERICVDRLCRALSAVPGETQIPDRQICWAENLCGDRRLAHAAVDYMQSTDVVTLRSLMAALSLEWPK